MRNDKKKAISLRKKGKSYNEIVKILGTPKSTLSLWLKDIRMSSKIEKQFWGKVRKKWANHITSFSKRRAIEAKERAKNIQLSAAKEIGKLTKRELFLIGTALYWAEGNKRNKWSIRFVNSDSNMIKLMMKFFREICCIDEKKFNARIHLHPNIKENKAINFWSKIIKIPKRQFAPSQTQISKSSQGKRNPHQLPYGTLHIEIHDVNMTNRVKGWILGMS
ncbi:MAG: hypothetical protein U9P90_01755 [Patescibacteria group bacterium]|nr:hypothetical protein [Patescibacteria group bacterium]